MLRNYKNTMLKTLFVFDVLGFVAQTGLMYLQNALE